MIKYYNREGWLLLKTQKPLIFKKKIIIIKKKVEKEVFFPTHRNLTNSNLLKEHPLRLLVPLHHISKDIQ